MKELSVAELRQNPSPALDDVERGETYVITRYRRQIGMLVPMPSAGRHLVTAADAATVYARTPLTDDWAAELQHDRATVAEDPWVDV